MAGSSIRYLLALVMLATCHSWMLQLPSSGSISLKCFQQRAGFPTLVVLSASSPESNESSEEESSDDVIEIDSENEIDSFSDDIGEMFDTVKKGVVSQVAAEDLLFLQSLGAITSRGEQATEQQIQAARKTVSKLEELNPTSEPAYSKALQGTWELVFTDTKQLFRSSPFFMAGRAVCTTKEQAKQYDWFCTMHRKALAISTIGPVRQIISSTRLVSEFETQAGAVPFLYDFTPFSYSGGLPLTIDGAIVSSADLSVLNATAFELYMDTVEIKGSNIPGLRQVLDRGLKLRSRMLGDFLESNVASYKNPRPVLQTTFLSSNIRISRDQDDNIYVYVKTSDSTEPTDYSAIDADLGIARLLEGFNDAVTKFYL